MLPDRGELLDSFGRLIYWDVEFGLLAAGALLVTGRRPLPAGVGLAVPFLLAAVLTALAAATVTGPPGGAEPLVICEYPLN